MIHIDNIIKETQAALLSSRETSELRNKFDASYYEFFKYFWPTVVKDPFEENWHHKELCEQLQKTAERLFERLPFECDTIINISPGETKSTLVSVLFPVWLWTIDPSLRIISGSHSTPLCMKLSVLSRDCIKSASFQGIYGDRFQLRKDVDAKSHYKNNKGGERMIASPKSGVLGEHAHIILIDDPIDPKGVTSIPMLRAANNFVDNLSTRKVNKKIVPTILVMQRLGVKDPTGHLLAKPNKVIRHICLPATDKFPILPSHYKKFYKRGLMNPKRTGRKELDDAVIDLGKIAFVGQFGQQPVDQTGNYINRKMFSYYRLHDMPQGVNHIYIDTALSEKEEAGNDPTGFLIFRHVGDLLYLVRFHSEMLGFPQLIAKIIELHDLYGEHNKTKIFIENKANGKSVKQQLKLYAPRLNVFLDNVSNRLSKKERLKLELPAIEAGRVLVPYVGNWQIPFFEELEVFDNGDHDEAIDCLSGACRITLSRKKARGRTSRRMNLR